jgi:hypothetical protein
MDNKDRELEELKQRLEKLEAELIYLRRHLGYSDQDAPINYPVPAAVLELVRKGNKKEAYKLFMRETGASLKDAVTYVDAL